MSALLGFFRKRRNFIFSKMMQFSENVKTINEAIAGRPNTIQLVLLACPKNMDGEVYDLMIPK